MTLLDSIITIKNIGEERAKKLQKLGIYTVNDLVEYFPRYYDDRSNVLSIKDAEINSVNTVKGKISTSLQTMKTRNISITKALIDDGTEIMEIVWYNKPYLKNSIKKNEKYIFTGKVIKKFGRLQMESPEYELLEGKDTLSNGRIVPIYASTHKFSQKLFRSVIYELISTVKGRIEEILPSYILKENNICTREFAIQNIHFPKDNDSFFIARRRLVFEEFFLLQMKLLQLKGAVKKRECDVCIKSMETEPIISKFPFDLTKEQQKVIDEIKRDLELGKVMNRLVQGDVGSGKTAIAEVVSYIAINNGYQVALMAPTDVLAVQHFENFSSMFKDLGIKCVLLSGSQRAKEKREVYELIKTGEANIVIGTHAIIQEKVEFSNLGFIITDEQHRFGVKQRDALYSKGKNPHTLVMSATPIPRTLALILYGDLDISIIGELPPNRKSIDTMYVTTAYRKRVYDFIKKNTLEKRQTYIICPMVEENDKMELKSVLSYTKELKDEIFAEFSVECIYGKMKGSEKQDIMDRFYNRDIDILVSTTVIEVGINVPNATIMIIENAERFGISQLHQLRGRVGRGGDKSYCVLISDAKNKQSIQRLKIIEKYLDGFVLSEKDLEIRGGGDFFGTRQHGLPELKIANLYKDMNILKEVQKVSLKLYENDPYLDKKENIKLKEKIENFFANTYINTSL